MILSSDYAKVRFVDSGFHRRQAFDEHEYEERVKFADQQLNLDNLPPGVFLGRVPFRTAIEINFTRDLTNSRAEHVTVTIPFGVGQVYSKGVAASEVAMDLVERNENAYSRVGVFNKTKFGGKGIFQDETDRLFLER